MTNLRSPIPISGDERRHWLYRRVSAEQQPQRLLVERCIVGGAFVETLPEPILQAPPLDATVPDLASEVLNDHEVARRIHELPPLPQALTEALRIVRNDLLPTDAFVFAIERDATLAARVLRLANSPFYGVCGRVSTLDDAVRLLGLRTVASVVAAASLRSAVGSWQLDQSFIEVSWKHATATAAAARELAPAAFADPNEAFLAGLLHDLGRQVLAVFVPGPARLARALSATQDIESREAELRIIGRSHEDIGAAVARHWLLPEIIVASIESHHCPSEVRDANAAALAAVVHVADAVVHALDLTGDPIEAVPPVDDTAWRLLAPSESQMQSAAKCATAAVTSLASGQ